MDIYSFLNSADIAAHCREIDKVWTPYEMAIIIGRSHRTLAERHTAWRELIENYPDMPTPKNMHYDSRPSLHDEIGKVLDYEECLIEFFKSARDDVVYTFKIRRWDVGKGYYYEHDEDVFTNFESLWEAMLEEWDGYIYDNEITVSKVMTNKQGSVTAYMSIDGTIYHIDGSDCEPDGEIPCLMPFEIIDFQNMRYIDIPVPFKRGDILVSKWSHMRGQSPEEPFVLDRLHRDNEKWFAGAMEGKNGDGSDLTGWGFCVNENGLLCSYEIGNHDTLEHFKDKLSGKERLLQYVSWQMRDEIDFAQLMHMQCRIVAKQSLENFTLRGCGNIFPEKHIIAAGEADHEELNQIRPNIKIEIESRKSIAIRAKEPFSPFTSLISIADANADFEVLEYEPTHVLQVKFDDVDESDEPQDKHHILTDEQAKEIADFIMKANTLANTLIIQCEYGQSRSAAIAAAARQYYFGDGIEIFADERYYPNRFIYQKALNALRG